MWNYLLKENKQKCQVSQILAPSKFVTNNNWPNKALVYREIVSYPSKSEGGELKTLW